MSSLLLRGTGIHGPSLLPIASQDDWDAAHDVSANLV